MSQVVKLLILPIVIKDRMALHANVDDKLVIPEIKAAQDMKIRPLLGSVLFDKLLDDVNSTNGATGKYKILFENFIIDCICNYVMAELAGALNYQYWNKGVATKESQDSTSADMATIFSILDKYKTRAEHYAHHARRFIMANINDFPEYHAPGGIDTVVPDATNYSNPIFLGLEWDNYGRPNKDPNKNSNDPSYYI